MLQGMLAALLICCRAIGRLCRCRSLVVAPLKAVLPRCRRTPKTSDQSWPRRSS
jgi:hypothetical protein